MSTIKKDINIFFWGIKAKRPDEYNSAKGKGRRTLHQFNYCPFFSKRISVYSLNNQQNICDTVFKILGEGRWLLKGWHKAKTKTKVVNYVLAEVELKDTDENKYVVRRFNIRGLSHYWFWNKTPEEIDSVLESGTVKTLWYKL